MASQPSAPAQQPPPELPFDPKISSSFDPVSTHLRAVVPQWFRRQAILAGLCRGS